MTYTIIALILFFCMLCVNTKEGNTYKEIIYYFVAVLLIFVSSLRYEGVDYYGYMAIYNDINPLLELTFNNIQDTHGELGFLIINSIIKTFNGGFELVLFIISLLCVYLLVKNSCKYTLLPLLTILLYYNRFFIDRNLAQIRAAVACMIVIYALEYVKKRNWTRFIITLMCAIMFHKISIIGVFMYFMDKIRIRGYVFIVIVIVSFFIGMWIPIDNSVQLLVAYIGDFKFSGYLGDTDHFMKDLGLFYPVTIMQLFVLIFLNYHRDKLERISPYFNLLFNMYLFSTVWLLLFHKFGIYAGRLATLYGTAEVLLISYVPLLYVNKKARIISMFFIIVLSFSLMLLKISDTEHCPEYKNLIEFWF